MTETGALDDDTQPLTALAVRGAVGGVLMGLANLVPGISGGTMLLAAGVYPQFIRAIAEVTTLRFRVSSLVVLGSVVATAGVAIVALAGPVKDFVVYERWVAYSLFIGLTLGGIPLVRRMLRHPGPSVYIAAAIGFAVMAVIGLAQASQPGSTGSNDGFLFMLLAGVAGASAMILPGISGGYLLLILGVYVPILDAVDQVKDALKAADLGAIMDPALHVLVPVGFGVVAGIVGVSNLLKWLLARFEQPTLGVLLGLLLGAVVGLWPFQEGVAPEEGQVFKGQVLTAETLAEVEPEDYPTRPFTPTAVQVFTALGLIGVGFALTLGVARLGSTDET